MSDLIVAEGLDLRVVDVSDLDESALDPWLRRRGEPGRHAWPLGDGRWLADSQLIADMNWWAIAVDCPERDEFRRRWRANPTTVADVRDRMAWRCRLGRHTWRISSVSMSGHQSSRTHVCQRCLKQGLIVSREEPRGYYGGKVNSPMGEIEVRVRREEIRA